MELERYQALLCALELGSLSAAAEKLGYTPSGVSRMMAALETETGFPLLLRGKEGVAPTPECERLLPALREWVFRGESVKQLSMQLQDLDVGALTIGTAYSAYYSWLARVTSAFHAAYPGISIKLRSGYSSELLAELDRHTVDLAIMSQREGAHRWIPLCRDRMMAMVPPGHALAGQSAVPVSAFAAESYIDTYPGLDIDNARVFKRCDVAPNTQFSTMDTYATFCMVKAGLGISMNNEINSRQWVGEIGILPLEPPQQVAIGLAAAASPSPACATFLKFAAPYLRELQAE